MKKTGHDSSYSLKSRSHFSQANMFAPLHALIASSTYTAKLMASTFREPVEKVAITGLPRNDVLVQDITDADLDSHQILEEKIAIARQRGATRILLYAPTFRPNGSNPIDTLDLETLDKTLADTASHLLISLHPKFARKDDVALSSYQHIEYVEAGFDIYPQLKHIDTLITDYSSLYVDFLLLDRPIIFYTYDIETYRVEMGLHDDFDTLTPGPHPKSTQELAAAISTADEYQTARAEVRTVLFASQAGSASAHVAKAFIHK
jgi:CDP-glycerol glycerophosphotransferase (TagB/SpsB family)